MRSPIRSRRPTPDCLVPQLGSVDASSDIRNPGNAGRGTDSRRRLGTADGPPLRGDDSNLFLRPEPREPRGLHLLDQRVGRQTASVRSFGNPPRVIAEARETHSRKLDGNAEIERLVRTHPPKGEGVRATSKRTTVGPRATRVGESCNAKSGARTQSLYGSFARSHSWSGRSEGCTVEMARS